MPMGLLPQAAVALGAAGLQPPDLVPGVVVTAAVAESVTQRRLDGAVDWPASRIRCEPGARRKRSNTAISTTNA